MFTYYMMVCECCWKDFYTNKLVNYICCNDMMTKVIISELY